MNYQYLDNLMKELVDKGLPCCSLHIAQHGKLLYDEYFGYADVQATKPLSGTSIFRMASMSKLPLYTTLMILYEQGRLVLSDPIYRYFPEWKTIKKAEKQADGSVAIVPAGRPITVKDVMSMACGLPYCMPGMAGGSVTQQSMAKCMEPLWARGHYTLREEIKAISGAVLSFEPGTHWMYGFSSELAAGLVEAVCDKPANDVFCDLLFKPLGMDNTRPYFFGDIKERMVALFAQQEDGTCVPTSTTMDEKHNPGIEFGAGNPRLFSTGRDYSRLMQMLACGGELDGVRVMGRKTIDLMRSNTLCAQQLVDFRDDYNAGYGYGYGVRTLMDKAAGNNNGSIGAFGWTGGFGTWCEADPEDGVSIVYMHNLFPGRDDTLHGRIRAAAYGIVK